MTTQRIAIALTTAIALAIPAEGLRQVAYRDPPGILTVCWGHTGKDVDKARRYSLDECKALLTQDMTNAINIVDKCVPGLPVPILASFADAVFNIGPKIACDTTKSTAARLLAAKDYRGACEQLPRWRFANVGGVQVALPGLEKRRNAEMNLCLQGLELESK